MNIHSSMPRAESAQIEPHTGPSKRDLILRAATTVFARHGFFSAQVADVAREAGVAAGTVYLYFRSKDDLLASIFERNMKDARAEARAALDGLGDPVARLRALARLHLDRLGRDRDLAVVFQVELRQSTKFMEQLSTTHLREYLGLMRDTIADAQAAGEFRTDVNPTMAAKVLFGALDEMATNWILSKRRYSLVDEADAVLDILLNGLSTAHGVATADMSTAHGSITKGTKATKITKKNTNRKQK